MVLQERVLWAILSKKNSTKSKLIYILSKLEHALSTIEKPFMRGILGHDFIKFWPMMCDILNL